MEEEIVIQVQLTNNPNTFVFEINKVLIRNKFKLYHKSSKNIEESNLVYYLFETFSEVAEIFVKLNFISISFSEHTQLSKNYIEAIKNTIYNFIKDGNKIICQSYVKEFSKIEKCINEYINPALESEGGLFLIYKYSKKNKHLVIQTIGSCRNNPGIIVDLDQTKRIINNVCNLDILNISPISLND